MITDAIYLIMRGVSTRNAARQLKTVHGADVSNVTVNGWVRKYVGLIKEYTDTLVPKLSDVWSIDEMHMNVKNTEKMAKGFHVWLWSIMTPTHGSLSRPPSQSAGIPRMPERSCPRARMRPSPYRTM